MAFWTCVLYILEPGNATWHTGKDNGGEEQDKAGDPYEATVHTAGDRPDLNVTMGAIQVYRFVREARLPVCMHLGLNLHWWWFDAFFLAALTGGRQAVMGLNGAGRQGGDR